MKPQNSSTPNQAEVGSGPEDSLSIGRRRLLQALAATGGAAVAANLVPAKWTRPVVEVGYLPVHAQASGFVLSNGSLSFIPNLSCNNGGGNVYTVSFDFNNPFGGVETGSLLEHSFEFQPSGSSGQFTLVLTTAEISGDGFQGTISYAVCLAFANDSQLTTTLRLTDTNGRTSEALSFTISRPSGALDNDQTPGPQVSPR